MLDLLHHTINMGGASIVLDFSISMVLATLGCEFHSQAGLANHLQTNKCPFPLVTIAQDLGPLATFKAVLTAVNMT